MRTLRWHRPLLALVLALAALALAACGGTSSGAPAAGADSAGAQAMPAGTLAFVDVNIATDSTAWKQAESLGAHFPGWDRFLQELQDRLAQPMGDSGDSFDTAVRPWLGGELAA